MDTFLYEQRQDEVVAIIQNGTLKNEKIGIGTISTIQQIVVEKQLSSPAIIIIGEVVEHRVVLGAIQNTFASA